MKKVGLSDTVLVDIARKLRVERVKFFVFPGFLATKIAKNASKKSTKISRYFNLRDGIKPRDFCGIKNPVIL